MRCFTLKDVEFSLEEAVAINGFFGWVLKDGNKERCSASPIAYDKQGKPLDISAVIFTTPKA